MTPISQGVRRVTENDLHYLGGICDGWGSVRIDGKKSNRPHPVVVFKSPFRDKLEAIQMAAGGIGSLSTKPSAPSGHSVRPPHFLVFQGVDYYHFEGMVWRYLRVKEYKDRFMRIRQELSRLRDELGLTYPFELPPADEDVANVPT